MGRGQPRASSTRLQPDFERLEGAVDDFVGDLSRVAKNRDANGKTMPRFVDELKTVMAPAASINDKTDAAMFDGLQSADADELGQP